jgi:hypothetical protein
VTPTVALAALFAAAPRALAQPAAAPPALDDACRAGLAHERAGALPSAFLELSRCAADAAGAGAADSAALRRVKKKLAAGDYAPVAFSVRPAGTAIRIAPFTDGAPLREPYELWLPFGRHTYAASAPGHGELRGEIVVDSPARILLQIELEPVRRAGGARAVDFEADGPAVDAPIVVADPRPKKLPSLIPERFRRGLGGEPDAAAPSAHPSDSAGGRRPAPPVRRRPRTHRWPWILTWGL